MTHLATYLPAVFWAMYSLSNTLLIAPPSLGPITALNVLYLAMLPAGILCLFRWRDAIAAPGMAAYAVFMAWVILGLIWLGAPVTDANLPQRLLIYGLFGLGAAQLMVAPAGAVVLAESSLLVSAGLSAYTLFHAVQTGFSYRAGVPVNPNLMSNLIAPGIVVAMARRIADTPTPVRRRDDIVLAVGGYACLLLGSRGVWVALAAAGVVLVWHTRPAMRQLQPLALIGALVIAAGQVPAVVNCTRFPEQCFASAAGNGEPLARRRSRPPARTPRAEQVPAPAPLSAADEGHGSYPALRRLYRFRWVSLNWQGRALRASPFSPSIAFTPSGRGRAVRLTRASEGNVPWASHWEIQESIDGRQWKVVVSPRVRQGEASYVDTHLAAAPEEAPADAEAAREARDTRRRRRMLFGRLAEGTGSISARVQLWQAGLHHLVSHPRALVVGEGMGTSQAVAHGSSAAYDSMHNAPLQILLDFGLIGAACFAIFHLQIVWALGRRQGWIAALFLSSVILWGLFGLTATVTDIHPYWLFLGVAAGWAMSPGRDTAAHP